MQVELGVENVDVELDVEMVDVELGVEIVDVEHGVEIVHVELGVEICGCGTWFRNWVKFHEQREFEVKILINIYT